MCNGDAWGPKTHITARENCRICGIFGADFGDYGWYRMETRTRKLSAPHVYNGSGQAPTIGRHNMSITLMKHGVTVDVTLIGQQEAVWQEKASLWKLGKMLCWWIRTGRFWSG